MAHIPLGTQALFAAQKTSSSLSHRQTKTPQYVPAMLPQSASSQQPW
jgi:hypothetical protein